MYSLEVIQDMNRKAARKARQGTGKQPYVAKCDNDAGVNKIPNFGDYRPKNWELVETYFVDNSGFGAPGEPALTFEEFCSKVKAGFGYAIIEQGQFQLYVGEFKRI